MRMSLYMAIATLAIAVYLGLAVYIIVRNPRRSISWVFGGVCLSVAGYYLFSLFLFPGATQGSATPIPLRLKWAVISLGVTFYFHLVSFYFPHSWQRFVSWSVPFSYLISVFFAAASLFTDFLIAGPLHRPSPHIIGPIPGALMSVFSLFFILDVIIGTYGLLAGYRAAISPSLRQQILNFLIPTGLIILNGAINWLIILTMDIGGIPHEVGDVLIFLVAFFYSDAVLRFGTFVGSPFTRRDLLYAFLTMIGVFGSISLAFWIDQYWIQNGPYRYPLMTILVLVVFLSSYPVVSRWATDRLDSLFFRQVSPQPDMQSFLFSNLRANLNPVDIQSELLGLLCSVADVRGGFLALPESDSSKDLLVVTLVHGSVSVKVGDIVSSLPLRDNEPRLASGLLPEERESAGWRAIQLYCPLVLSQSQKGLLALGQKHDRAPFSAAELSLCGTLARQFQAAIEMARLSEKRNGHLQTAYLHNQAVKQLGDELIETTQHTLAVWAHGQIPLEIRVLGALQVVRNGKLVLETDWKTERAKVLFAFLIWKGKNGVAREEILEALWSDTDYEKASNNFHVTVHRLRRALEPNLKTGRDSLYITHSRGRYRFNFDAPHWLDVTAFESLAAMESLPERKQAIELYRGSYLKDVILGLPPDIEIDRLSYERIYVETLRGLAADSYSEREKALYLEKLVAVEPLDQDARQALIELYLNWGRHDLVRRQLSYWRETCHQFDLDFPGEAQALWQKLGD